MVLAVNIVFSTLSHITGGTLPSDGAAFCGDGVNDFTKTDALKLIETYCVVCSRMVTMWTNRVLKTKIKALWMVGGIGYLIELFTVITANFHCLCHISCM